MSASPDARSKPQGYRLFVFGTYKELFRCVRVEDDGTWEIGKWYGDYVLRPRVAAEWMVPKGTYCYSNTASMALDQLLTTLSPDKQIKEPCLP